MLHMSDVCCVIMCGGYSTRMGTPKANLRFNQDENFLGHICHVYHSSGVTKVVVVKNFTVQLEADLADADVVKVDNFQPDLGRLYTLQLGIKAAGNPDFVFVQNIDNPFVHSDLIAALYRKRNEAELITPQYEGKGGHPILLGARPIEKIRSLKEYHGTLREVLDKFSRCRVMTGDALCVANINEPKDYDYYIKNSEWVSHGCIRTGGC